MFVIEQNVDRDIEYDEYENGSVHILATLNHESVATARWRSTEKGIKLERFAVLKKARGLRVGEALVQFCLTHVDLSKTIYLHAQERVMPFYAKLGFQKCGERFIEANIPHFLMKYHSDI